MSEAEKKIKILINSNWFDSITLIWIRNA